MTGTETSLLVACAILGAGGLLAGCLAVRRLYRGLKEWLRRSEAVAKQTGATCERLDQKLEKYVKGAAALDKKYVEGAAALNYSMEQVKDKVLWEVQKEAKTIRREIVNVANAALAASWDTQTRPRRVNAALPLVLIAQIQRSGGTLLSQLFDGHPEVFAFPHELKWGNESKYLWPHVDPQTDGPLQIAHSLVASNLEDFETLNLFGYTKGGPALQDNQHLPIQWSQWAYVKAFLENWETVRPQSRRQCFDIFMSAYFSALFNLRASDKPKKIIAAFVPRMNFIQSYPENNAFFNDYPDGLMISICRQPADWYASASRDKSVYADVDRAMEQWRESAESAMHLKERHSDHVALVSFEILVADPAGVMRGLAERLGLAWHPILATPTFNGWPIGSNSSFRSIVGIDASAVGRRDSLAPELREQIEARNLAVYERFITRVDVCSSKVTI